MDHRTPDELASFEAELARLLPVSDGLSLDRLLFEAGVASVRRPGRSGVVPWLIAASLLFATGLASFAYFQERGRSARLLDLFAFQNRRLDSIERKTQVISEDVEQLARPPRSEYVELRARLIQGLDLPVESLEISSKSTPSKNRGAVSIRGGSLDL
jgi:hypothetical protein